LETDLMAQTVQKDVLVPRPPALRLVAEKRYSPVRFEAMDAGSGASLRLVAQLMTAAGSQLAQDFSQPGDSAVPPGRSGLHCRARLVLDTGSRSGSLAACSGLKALYASEGLKGLLAAPQPRVRVVTAALGEGCDVADWHRAAIEAWGDRPGAPRAGVIGASWAPVRRAEALSALWPTASFRPLALAEALALFATDASAFDLVLATDPAAEVFAALGAALSGTRHCAARVLFAGPEEHFEDISIARCDKGSSSDPSGLLLAAIWLLRRAGEPLAAERLHNAWFRTLEDGLHTEGLALLNPYCREVSAAEFADALAERLGQQPRHRPPVQYGGSRSKLRGSLRICR
jgi:hypothetical protein